jgi:succinate dehydrogenase/fumarate reductase flavoprotein subunit
MPDRAAHHATWPEESPPWDVVVVGGGMAGLVAGLEAVEAGARTLVLERDREVGGSARLASGFLAVAWEAEAFVARNVADDPTLARAVLDDYPALVEWLAARGTPLSDLVPDVMYGALKGHFVREPMAAMLGRLATRFAQRGGRLECSVRAVAAERRAAATFALRLEGPTGPALRYGRALVLATGGFQADASLTAQHVGRVVPRTNPYSVGDGLRLGESLGAARAGAMDRFYGHLLPAPTAHLSAEVAAGFSQYYSPHCVLLNRGGDRFVDESAADEHNAWALAQQDSPVGWLVFDEAVRRTYLTVAPFPHARDVDRLAQAVAAGARIVRADDVSGLAARLAEEGVPAARARQSLSAYQAAARPGAGPALQPPRARFHHPLAEPPLQALQVVPSIYFTYGGLRANSHGQALDAAGRPVPGLYVAGADVGGVHQQSYTGGLAASAVFGRRAGRAAAAFARRGRNAVRAAPPEQR